MATTDSKDLAAMRAWAAEQAEKHAAPTTPPEQQQRDMDLAAQTILGSLKRHGDVVEMSVADLEAIGLGLKTREYADWLLKHGLRMQWPVRGQVVKFSLIWPPSSAPLQGVIAAQRGADGPDRAMNGGAKMNCRDCGALIGQLHLPGCDVERCPDCGGQAISCDCEGDFKHQRLPWTGQWPGDSECAEFGWWARWVAGKGWVTCEATDDGAMPDLNRLAAFGVWDAAAGRFRRGP